MPMRPHCDRCDKLVESYPTWVEADYQEEHFIWHVRLLRGTIEDSLICRDCLLTILEEYRKHVTFASPILVDDEIPF